MANNFPDTIDIEKLFQLIPSKDPVIRISSNAIKLLPNYWNYNFVTFFLLLMVFIYILIGAKYDNENITLASIIFIIINVILIFYELRLYNTISINLKEKSITILPTPIYRLFSQTKNVQFRDIMTINIISNFSTGGFNVVNRRYIMILSLNDDSELSMISSNKKQIANEIARKLLTVFKKS